MKEKCEFCGEEEGHYCHCGYCDKEGWVELFIGWAGSHGYLCDECFCTANMEE